MPKYKNRKNNQQKGTTKKKEDKIVNRLKCSYYVFKLTETILDLLDYFK